MGGFKCFGKDLRETKLREILEALKKRDVVSAKKIVRNHIEIAKELVIRGYDGSYYKNS